MWANRKCQKYVHQDRNYTVNRTEVVEHRENTRKTRAPWAGFNEIDVLYMKDSIMASVNGEENGYNNTTSDLQMTAPMLKKLFG